MTKFAVLLAAVASLHCASASLWPIPTELTQGESPIWLAPSVSLQYGQGPGSGGRCGPVKFHSTNANKRVTDAWGRTKQAIFRTNIVPWKFHPKGSSFEPRPGSGSAAITHVVVSQSASDVPRPSYEQMREAYNLTIPAGCSTVYIDAESSLGVLHAFSTLQQLFYAPAAAPAYAPAAAPAAPSAVWGRGPVRIVDKPKFVHRGLNLDVARQWYPKEAILRTIDALSWNKMNRLHLHATDSQSWPLEIPAMPELAKKGSYAPGLTYSPADLQEILDFADARGIQVIVEIDMPGHTTSIAESHPDLIVGRNIQPNWGTYAAQPPSGSLKLNNAAVTRFLSKLMQDLLPRLNHHTAFFHSGGDEVNANVYELDPGVGTKEKPQIRPHLQKFVSHVYDEIAKQRMTPVVWEEMLLDWNLTLAKDAVVQTWQTDEATQRATDKGHRVIAGNYNYWYLDCGQGQWLDFGGPAYKQFYPFADYCSPRKNWRLIYSYSPTQFLTEKQAALVLGGEVHVWSEQIDSSSLDVMLWPRASAAAEVLWSGRTDAHGKNRTFADASPRLGEMRERMVARGVQASPVMQLWCHQNLGDCALNA